MSGPQNTKYVADIKDNDYVQVYIPATKTALVFRVVTRTNPYPTINYGAVPFTAGQNLSCYDGGSVAVGPAGSMPPRSYTTLGSSMLFTPETGFTGTYDTTDVWYTNEEYRDRIFYVVGKMIPSFVQIGLEYPRGVQQYRFQRDNVQAGIGTGLGYKRGVLETIQFPNLHQGWRFGNDSYFNVYTSMVFEYNELIVESPADGLTAYNVLAGVIPSRRIDLPIAVQDPSIPIALNKDYGYAGFDTTLLANKANAIDAYTTVLKGALI
jgi:hypothetical protein